MRLSQTHVGWRSVWNERVFSLCFQKEHLDFGGFVEGEEQVNVWSVSLLVSYRATLSS